MKKELDITDRLNLTEEERDQLERKEARNVLINFSISGLTFLAGWFVTREMNRRLVEEFSTEETTNENE